MTTSPALSDLARNIEEIALEAGKIAMQYFKTDVTIQIKDDETPVTIADQKAEQHIISRIRQITPDIPIIAEETTAAGHIPTIESDYFWLVDPLDGTKEFISGSGEFTVNIALIRNDTPVLGIVFAPALGELYTGYEDIAYLQTVHNETQVLTEKQPLHVRPFPDIGITAVASKRHGDIDTLNAFLKQLNMNIENFTTRGSSLKFCLIAAGNADIYPRFGPTYEWDTAAGDAVLRAAGGMTYTRDGSPFTYHKVDFWNKEFIASSKSFV